MNVFEKLRCKLAEGRWQKKFKKMHPKLSAYSGEPQKLRLILGPGRSGTTWLSRVLGKSATSLRFFIEPLHPFKVKLPLSRKFDRTAIPYQSSLDDSHPLVRVYKSLTFPEYNWDSLLPKELTVRNDIDFSFCLVKEVHSLLATEALLKNLKCPALFITRNPIYVVDSVLSYQGLDTRLWQNESNYITDTSFLMRYFPDQGDEIRKYYASNDGTSNNKKQIILSKVLTVSILNKMLYILSNELDFVYLIEYEKLCSTPNEIFAKAAAFLSLEIGAETLKFLNSTQTKKNEEYKACSIFRDTSNQLNRPLRFITDSEAEEARKALAKCKLF